MIIAKSYNLKLILLIGLAIHGPVYSQAGSLDLSFDSDGYVITDVGSDDVGSVIGIQPDGKILIGGGSNYMFLMIRYNIDGSIDTTFGNTGLVLTDVGPGYDWIEAVEIQTDGKILAAGSALIGSHFAFCIIRYLQDGTIDTTFGNGGIMTTDIGPANDQPFDMKIQDDGKIVLAGISNNGTDYDYALVRYHPNGVLDTTFSFDGYTTYGSGLGTDIASSVLINNDDKIIIGGRYSNGSHFDFGLVQYDIDGDIDSTFGVNGLVITDIASSHDYLMEMELQDDGKIIAAGNARIVLDEDFAVVRYNIDGSLDSTFGFDGIVTTDVYGMDYGMSVVLQTDNKIVIGGYSENSSADFALCRYNENGQLDLTFDLDGKVSNDFGVHEQGYSLAIQNDDKILLAGISFGFPNDGIIIARYHDGYVGAENIENKSAVKFYPNPTKDFIFIEFENPEASDQSYQLNIFNSIGQLVAVEMLSSGINQIPLYMSEGIYQFQIANFKTNFQTTIKVVVK